MHSVDTIHNALHNPAIKSVFYFLQHALALVNKFNIFFQSRTPVLITALEKSQTILITFLTYFLRQQYIKETNISQINVLNENNILELHEIFVCSKAKDELDKLPDSDKKFMLNKFLKFYQTVVSEIKDRLPFNDNVISFVSNILDQNSLFKSTTIPFVDLFKRFPSLKPVGYDNIDNLETECF